MNVCKGHLRNNEKELIYLFRKKDQSIFQLVTLQNAPFLVGGLPVWRSCTLNITPKLIVITNSNNCNHLHNIPCMTVCAVCDNNLDLVWSHGQYWFQWETWEVWVWVDHNAALCGKYFLRFFHHWNTEELNPGCSRCAPSARNLQTSYSHLLNLGSVFDLQKIDVGWIITLELNFITLPLWNTAIGWCACVTVQCYLLDL